MPEWHSKVFGDILGRGVGQIAGYIAIATLVLATISVSC